MTWTGPEGERHFKKPERERERGKRDIKRGDRGKERQKKGEVGEVKFGERVFIKRARGGRESHRDTYKEKETEEFTTGVRGKETLKRHPGGEEFLFSSPLFIRLSSDFSS